MTLGNNYGYRENKNELSEIILLNTIEIHFKTFMTQMVFKENINDIR